MSKLPRNRSHSFLPAVLPLVVAGVVLAGCSHPVQTTAAHKIADALPSVLGPAAHYEVQVDGDAMALARGRARAVHIQGRDVHLSPAITLDTLNADAHDVSFDRGTKRLTSVGVTDFTATLGQANLDAYLAQSKPLLPGLRVTLTERQVRARVPVTFLGLTTYASLTGTIRPNRQEPDKLDFVTQGAQVGVVPLPPGLINLALTRLNPVLSLRGAKVPFTLTRASVADRRLILQGKADLKGLVARQ